MAEPFLGEVKIVSFNFAPRGWAMCNGQFLPINQNQALFSLLGTMYGGNGQTTFALPDLRGRVPIHVGGGRIQGNRAGSEAHTVSSAEMPTHTHALMASSSNGNVNAIANTNVLAREVGNPYRAQGNLTAVQAGAVTNAGGSQPHNNMQPFLVLNFCIALQGIFPTQN